MNPPAKLAPVLSQGLAKARNSLILEKELSVRCRHRYIARPNSAGTACFRFDGVTAYAHTLPSVRIIILEPDSDEVGGSLPEALRNQLDVSPYVMFQ